MEVIGEMQPKGMQVTCRTLQKFEFEFHQNPPWLGTVDQDWRSKSYAPKCAS